MHTNALQKSDILHFSGMLAKGSTANCGKRPCVYKPVPGAGTHRVCPCTCEHMIPTPHSLCAGGDLRGPRFTTAGTTLCDVTTRDVQWSSQIFLGEGRKLQLY